MVTNKKSSYAMKVLQLALALSLLHVDPDNYLQELQLGNWEADLEFGNRNGWELEMLRAVPMVEYPYANRKAMVPLIEDLVRFDRERTAHQYNVTAYLLNIQNDNANQTAALQELQALPPTNNSPVPTTANGIISNVGTSIMSGNGSGESQPSEQILPSPSSPNNNISNFGIFPPDHEIFLNPESLHDPRPIWEQNLADLNDFADMPGMDQYVNLPLKDVQLENVVDLNVETFLNGFRQGVEQASLEGAVALNGTFPNPSQASFIKVEKADYNEFNENATLLNETASCSKRTSNCSNVRIKQENESSEQQLPEIDLSPFISSVDFLKEEENEIVEVLWKQDVDLGYSLNPALLSSIKQTSTVGNEVLKPVESIDEKEKLKALEELKNDKAKFEEKDNRNDPIEDEWMGPSFTIDMETGEIIRLPLDELLNDVLQLAEFSGDTNEVDNDSEASTSKAAAASNNNNFKLEEDNVEDKFNKDKTDNNSNNSQGEFNNNNSLNVEDLPQTEIEVSSLPSPLFDLDDEAKKELADIDKMLQSATASFHHNHHLHHHHHAAAAAAAHRGLGGAGVQTTNYPTVGSGVNSAFQRQPSSAGYHGHHQGRMPLSRGVSMEQRLQDIASLFNPIPSMGVVGGVSDMPPYPHYPTHHYGYQAAPPQHAQYPPPPPHHPHGHHAMLHANASLGDLCSTQPHYGHNLGSAVSSSMHLTNASHDSDAASAGAYKMEHDMMYYSNASSDMNHTSDGFINSILNDEDLHLMDMNVNDSFCRMVDVNNSTSNNSSVLGLSTSGHGSGSSVSTTGAGSLNAGVVPVSNNVGMTTDLMGPGAQGGPDRLDASSDSAVSSMGSERVPSLSDGEWGEGSDSAQDYHQGKYGGPYDYSYNNGNGNRLNDGTRQPPAAQKKHQMFGKRFPPTSNGDNTEASSLNATQANNLIHGPSQNIKYERDPYPMMPGLPNLPQSYENSGAMGPSLAKDTHNGYDIKYGSATPIGGYPSDYALRTPRTPNDIVQHNHTYTLPQGTGSLPRPQQRDKKLSTSSSTKSMKSSSSTDEHLTRDEKRARSLNIPIPVTDIINLPMDEFNERLSKYDLNENQLSLIRDIRRRGKNKVAAQNCRKRKLDQIISLEDEVREVVRRKEQLLSERESLLTERKRISSKFSALHRHIFQYLRDADGNPCSPSEYSLQQAADGSVYLLPRDQNNKTDPNNSIGAVGGGEASGAGANNLNHNIPSMHQQQAGPPQNIHPSMMHHTHHQQNGLHQHAHQQLQQQGLSQQQQHLQQQHHHHTHQHHPTQQKD